ncbi:hypothetical protein CSB09_04815 [Candidatus Gracilibacteria bacterium]|nr:MAG: hypothetical protein CSB09_04815 [Candidatus Gracilibacteria bacterium]
MPVKEIPVLKNDDTKVQRLQEELKMSNIQLYRIYEAAVIGRNPLALREKTVEKFNELKNEFGSRRYKKFLNSVNRFVVIRYDEFQGDVFKAPIFTGRQTGGGHYADQAAKAENYVYASFDKIPHCMTYFRESMGSLEDQMQGNKNLHCIDEKECFGRAELVFGDIDNILTTRFDDNDEGILERYMNNCFEYREGKKLLALYLSIILEKPEDIPEFFQDNNCPDEIQYWYNQDYFGEISCYKYDLEKNPQMKRFYKSKIKKSMRKQRMIEKMKEVYKKTGLFPPYSLEIRIQNEVKKANIESFTQQRVFHSKISQILRRVHFFTQ